MSTVSPRTALVPRCQHDPVPIAPHPEDPRGHLWARANLAIRLPHTCSLPAGTGESGLHRGSRLLPAASGASGAGFRSKPGVGRGRNGGLCRHCSAHAGAREHRGRGQPPEGRRKAESRRRREGGGTEAERKPRRGPRRGSRRPREGPGTAGLAAHGQRVPLPPAPAPRAGSGGLSSAPLPRLQMGPALQFAEPGSRGGEARAAGSRCALHAADRAPGPAAP